MRGRNVQGRSILLMQQSCVSAEISRRLARVKPISGAMRNYYRPDLREYSGRC